MLPKGWDFGHIFGAEAETRALQFDRLPDGVMQKINARTTQEKAKEEQDLALPGTASNWEIMLAFGLSLVLFGAALLRRGRSAIGLRGRASTASVGRMGSTSAREHG
jgi:hypothetical protein